MSYAGLDIGTSTSKLVVYRRDGCELLKLSRRYAEEGSDGRRELNPRVVLQAVDQLLRELGSSEVEPVEALAIASLGESFICVDAQGQFLGNSMVTGDKRGAEETQALSLQFGELGIMRRTGLVPSELYSLPKLMWLHRHTDITQRSHSVYFYEDYFGHYLTGVRAVSYSSASRSMAFDIVKNEWIDEYLALAGLSADQFSPPVPSATVVGRLLPEMAQRYGLNANMLIVAGCHDQAAAALGSGLCEQSSAETSMGTCEFMLTMLPGPQASQYMIDNHLSCIPYVIPETYLTSLEVTTCGILKNWARDLLYGAVSEALEAKGQSFYGDFIEHRMMNLRSEVLALPQFGSSGNPNLSMNATGTLAGLSIHTKPEEIYLAIIEGMSFQLKLAYQRLESLGVRVERIMATGGGAASDASLQVRADVFNMDVIRMRSQETGTLGCMLLAACAHGAYSSLEDAIHSVVKVGRVFHPSSEAVEYYAGKYERYCELFRRMGDF